MIKCLTFKGDANCRWQMYRHADYAAGGKRRGVDCVALPPCCMTAGAGVMGVLIGHREVSVALNPAGQLCS